MPFIIYYAFHVPLMWYSWLKNAYVKFEDWLLAIEKPNPAWDQWRIEHVNSTIQEHSDWIEALKEDNGED